MTELTTQREGDWRADARTLALLRVLWRGGWGYLWRKPGTSYWINPQNVAQDLKRLDEQWASGTCWGVHPASKPRSAHERARAEDIAAVNCLYADFDAPDDLTRIEALEIAPSVIIASGGGWHCYWLLREPRILADDEERRDWAELQKWWVRHIGADPAACDLARVLRVPGTTNEKYDPPREVRFQKCDLGKAYDVGELLGYILDARAAELRKEEDERPAQPEQVIEPAANGRAAANGRGESPIEQYNRKTDIRDALREYGYAVDGKYFTRPGKDPRKGASGTIDVARNRAYTFSTNDPAFDASNTSPSGAGCTIRPFDLLCRLRFSGDAKAAVKWLIETGQVSVNGHAPKPKVSVNGHAPQVGGSGGDTRPPDTLAAASRGAGLEHQPDSNEHELTESRAGELLALNFGRELRYTPGRGWLVWDGRRWREDTDEREAVARVRLIGGAYLARALEVGKPLDRAFFNFGKRILSADGTQAVLKQGRRFAPVGARDEDFDRDPWLLNTPSGIVHLRTGEVSAHTPDAMLTRITNAPFDPQSEAPRWVRFLYEVWNDEATRQFVRRWLGYCLTGDIREQRYVVAWGGGANGKSTLFNTIRYVLGDYVAHINTDAIAMHRNAGAANPDIAKLPGVRLAIAPEWDEAIRADETLLKSITGGDAITTRYLFRNTFTFTPTCKLVIFGNAKPTLRGTDAGTWRRPILLPFTQQFTGDKADPTLTEKLRGEAPGILADLVRGCLEWLSAGLGVPAALEQAKEGWRDECDDVTRFINECCVKAPHARASVGQLHKAYQEWGGGIRTQKAFGAALRMLGYTSDRTRGRFMVSGLGLMEDD